MDTYLNEWIAKRGYKKKWLADQLGVSGNVLSRWANGRSEPSLKNALRLAALLDCRVEDLYKLKKPPQ